MYIVPNIPWQPVEQDLIVKKYCNTSGDRIATRSRLPNATSTYCCYLDVIEGEVYRIYGKGSTSATLLYAMADADRYIIEGGKSISSLNARTIPFDILIPNGVSILVVNLYQYDATTDKVLKMGNVKKKDWDNGTTEKLYVTYDKMFGNQTILVSSDANTGNERTKSFDFNDGVVTKTLTVNQQSAAGLQYVQNGLFLWLDGINKGNVANSWVDLIGGKVFTNHGATFNNDNIEFDGVDDYLDATAFSVPLSEDGTIEVVMDIDAISGKHFPVFKPTTSGGIMFFWASGGYIIWSYGTGNRGRPVPKTKKGAWSFSNTGRYYENGKDIGINNSAALVSSNGMYIGRRSSDYGKGKIYCIRIYNRKLSFAEIQQNLAVDNMRFNLGLSL